MAATVPSSAILAACLVLASLGSVSATSTCKPPCQWAGLYLPHPQDCSKFYVCNEVPKAVEFSCQPGLEYDMVNRRCDWPDLANCQAGPERGCDEILLSPGKPESSSTQGVPDPVKPTESSCTPRCPWAGAYLGHPQDCAKFYVCDNSLNAVVYNCQPGLVYNVKEMLCDWPSNYECLASPETACDELIQ